MNCARHPDRAAVGQCAQCGAYVCAECAEATKSLRDTEGTLCVDCYRRDLASAGEYYRQSTKRRLIRVIISIICYIAGIVMMIVGPSGDTLGLFAIPIGLVLCGLFNAIAEWRKESERHAEHERKYGVTYTVTDTEIKRDTGLGMKVFMFILGAVLGVVITPINVIKDIVGMRSDTKTAAMFDEEAEAVAKI